MQATRLPGSVWTRTDDKMIRCTFPIHHQPLCPTVRRVHSIRPRSCRLNLTCHRRHITASAAGSSSYQSAQGIESPFTQAREMDATQSALSGIPQSALYLLAALLVGAGAGAGFLAGGRIPVSARTLAQAAGAVVGAVAAAVGAVKLQEIRGGAAVIELHNLLVDLGNPTQLTREQVEQINQKYGIDMAQKYVDELKSIYGMFLETCIPPGDLPLSGYEFQYVANFKSALGLSDVDAAAVHMDVGRRILRSRFEAGSKGGDLEQRKTFQKLIYVSTLVFGEQQAAFLLPWRRVFDLSDAFLVVAKQQSAKQLFQSFISKQGDIQANKSYLKQLKTYQDGIRLADEDAEKVIEEAVKTKVEDAVSRALVCIKKRGSKVDYSDAIKELRSVIDYTSGMSQFVNDPEVVKGLGKFEVDPKKFTKADLRDLYRIYLEQRVTPDARMTDSVESDLVELRALFGLGTKEAEGIRDDVLSRVYRKLLREEVTSQRLASAASPAAVLEGLCTRLHFNPASALALHKSIYNNKLESLLEKKKLTDEDADELSSLQKMLCIPKQETQQLHSQLCGKIYRAAVEDAVSTGIEGFDTEERNKVQQVQQDVKLDDKMALEVVSEVGKKAFMGFIVRSRGHRNRLDAAKELKKLVFFSNVVIAPLVEDLKSGEEDAKSKAMAELAKVMAEAKEKAAEEEAAEKAAEAAKAAAEGAPSDVTETTAEQEAESQKTEAEEKAESPKTEAEEKAEPAGAVSENGAAAAEKEGEAASEKEGEAASAQEDEDAKVATLVKAEKAAEARKDGEEVAGKKMLTQNVVTVKNELDERERLDIYRNFLLYCMSGDVVSLPMGSSVVVERDESEFARLSQLGDVLGLTQFDVMTVHQGLAEQAFRSQVQGLVGDGIVTKEKEEQLTQMREKLGLPKEAADKIIKGVQNQKLIGTLQTQRAQGQLSVEKLVEMKDQGIEIETFVGEEMRSQLYAKELSAVLSRGDGEVDEAYLLEQLPDQLVLDHGKVKRIAEELAKSKKRTILVQAISALRQRNTKEAVASLNNLLVASKLVPGGQEKWGEKAEVSDLFCLYCTKESNSSKREGVQKVLGLADSEAKALAEAAESGAFKVEEAEEQPIF